MSHSNLDSEHHIKVEAIEGPDPMAYMAGYLDGFTGSPILEQFPDGMDSTEYRRGHDHGGRVQAGESRPSWHTIGALH